MVLKDVALLAADTARTKAYLQMMARENLMPSICIVYTDDIEMLKKQASDYEKIASDYSNDSVYFDLHEPILFTIESNGFNYRMIDEKDINSDLFEDVLKEMNESFFIYSGYGGCILKSHLFQLGKRFIHVHAGVLPQYRGSTTAYYSMLQEGYIGATAIFLSEGIDEGEIITQERYQVPPKGTNIDTLYEPYIRSQVLKKTLELYCKDDNLYSVIQESSDAQTYFIIHPVLKHLALMGDF